MTRNLRVSPRKLNLVAGLIRGKKVDNALADLEFSRKRIAQDVRKCVMSAVANAENNHGLDVNDLVVSEAYVGKNLVDEALRARGRGRASSILKPFSQITVIVRQTEEEKRPEAAKKSSKGRKAPAPSRPRPRPRARRQGREGPPPKAEEERSRARPGRPRRRPNNGSEDQSDRPALGVNRTWDSRWFAGRGEYGRLLHEDMRMREHILKQRRQAGIAKVVIERPHKKCRVTVHTARPGVLIGKKGADIEKLRSQLARFTDSEVHLNIVEIRKPEIDATLVAEAIAQQLERRVAFRRAMKRSVQSALRLGAQGIRINVAGRLGGAEIARTEWYREGRVPLHTLRADIDFGYGVAKTAYGVIGIKVWIFKGEIMEHDPMAAEKKNTELQESGGGRPRRDDRGDRGDRRDRGADRAPPAEKPAEQA